MNTERPWFAMYPTDLLNDPKFLAMSHPAQRAYMVLLCRCWMESCALPDSLRKLAALAGVPLNEFESLWEEIQDEEEPAFIPHPEKEKRLTNNRLYREWVRAEELAEVARENGKKGGRPPREENPAKTQPVTHGFPEETKPEPKTNPDQTQAKAIHNNNNKHREEKDPPNPPQGGEHEDSPLWWPQKGRSKERRLAAFRKDNPAYAAFKTWYDLYPRKASIQDAEWAWLKIFPQGVGVDGLLLREIMTKTQAVVRLWQGQGRPPDKFPYPATFLNKRQWTDADAAPAGKGKFSEFT